jgi:hypothetical protein
VTVFSKNYATWKWCLGEVVKILECRKNKGRIILPVFYEVDPFHVWHQLGSYAEAFVKQEQRFATRMNIVQKWRDALGEAATILGGIAPSTSNFLLCACYLINYWKNKIFKKWSMSIFFHVCTNRTEAELVEEIAMDVLQKLNRVYVGDLDHQITKLEQLAQLRLQYYKSIDTYENQVSYEATVERITELKMKRSVRMLRLTREMPSYMKDSEAYEKLF